MTDAIFEAGKIQNIRFQGWLAEQLTKHSAMYHIESKTEALHSYIRNLVEKSQAVPTANPKEEMVFCALLKRLIKKQSCLDTQNSPFFEKTCSQLRLEGGKFCKEIDVEKLTS